MHVSIGKVSKALQLARGLRHAPKLAEHERKEEAFDALKELSGSGPQAHKAEIEAIDELIASIGGTANMVHRPGRLHTTTGLPDLYCQIPPPNDVRASGNSESDTEAASGSRFWVEVKVGPDYAKPNQIEFIEREKGCGGKVVVGGLLEVREFLVQVRQLSS